MKYAADSFLNPKSIRIEKSFKQLETLRRVNGGYLAAPNPGKPDGTGRYDVFWLRDIMYATYANEYLGNMDEMIESFELVMTILMKHRTHIMNAIRKMPENRGLHARYHPNTLEEISPDWGHHQLDILGLFLYKTGDLIKKGHDILKEHEHKDLISDIIQYVYTFRWETHPDFGVWEEGPELHSSSVASVLAGLTMWHDDGHYNYKFHHNVELGKIIPVSERLFDTGRDELMKLLPRESAGRECDMSQLSLIWPYNIVDNNMKKIIVDNVESKLLGKHGVKRYKGDYYFNADDNNREGNEAEWPLGIAWLAIVHNKLAAWHKEDFKHSLGHLKKSRKYLKIMDDICVNGAIPELYSKGKPNENMPLAWAHSFHIIALQSFINSLEELRKHHNKEISEDLEPI